MMRHHGKSREDTQGPSGRDRDGVGFSPCPERTRATRRDAGHARGRAQGGAQYMGEGRVRHGAQRARPRVKGLQPLRGAGALHTAGRDCTLK